MMNILEIRDNGGETYDRYTVVYDEVWSSNGTLSALAMSEDPFHPLGFGQHCSAMRGDHLGELIDFDDLPEKCQKLVKQEIGELHD